MPFQGTGFPPGVWLAFLPEIEKFTKNIDFTPEIGDTLVLYTDGITEVMNTEGQLLDIRGLINFVKTHGEKDIQTMHNNILADIKAFCQDKYDDDMTLVLVRRIR